MNASAALTERAPLHLVDCLAEVLDDGDSLRTECVDALCQQAEHDTALRAALLRYVQRKLFAQDEHSQAAGAAVAERLLRSRGLLLPDQADNIWNWVFLTLRTASAAEPCSVSVAASFAARAADTLTQKRAADLYTGSLRPWLSELRLPWSGDDNSAVQASWSALEHVCWASGQTPGSTQRFALQVPMLLACFLSVERRVAPNLWQRHVTCGVAADYDASACKPGRAEEAPLRVAERLWCLLHGRTLCALQVVCLMDSVRAPEQSALGVADSCKALLRAAERYFELNHELESAMKQPPDGMPAEAWLSTQSTMLQAMQTAAFIDRSIFAELFVHVVRHGGAGADLVEEAAWRTAAFSVACLKSKSAPGTGADVLRCLLHSGALRVASQIAAAPDSTDFAVSQCLQVLLAAVRSAKAHAKAQSSLRDVEFCIGDWQLVMHRAAAAREATTRALGFELVDELHGLEWPDPARPVTLFANSAAEGPPLSPRMFDCTAHECLPALRGRSLDEAAVHLRLAWLKRALLRAPVADMLSILDGVVLGLEFAFEAADRPAPPACRHALLWRDVSVNADWAPVVDCVLDALVKRIRKERTLTDACDALGIFCRVCELRQTAAHATTAWGACLLSASTSALAELNTIDHESLQPSATMEVAARFVTHVRSVCQAEMQRDARAARRVEASACRFARAWRIWPDAAPPESAADGGVVLPPVAAVASLPAPGTMPLGGVEDYEPDSDRASSSDDDEHAFRMQDV